MGWDSCDAWKTKGAVKKAVLAGFDRNGVVVLASASGRDGYWFACKLPGGEAPWIECVLVDKCGSSFGYKAMHEMEGPFYYDCPKRVFRHIEGTPDFGVGSRSWRNEVRSRLVDS